MSPFPAGLKLERLRFLGFLLFLLKSYLVFSWRFLYETENSQYLRAHPLSQALYMLRLYMRDLIE